MPAPDEPARVAAGASSDAAPRELLLVELDWRPVAAFATAGLALVAAASVLGSVPRTLTWLVIGALLALALDPVVGRIAERLGGRRRAAVGLVLLALLFVVVVVGAVLGPETIRQGRNLQQDIPRTVDQLGDLPLVGDTLAENDVPERVEAWIDDLPQRLAGDSTAIEGAARSAASMMVAGFVTLLFTVTLLLDGQRFVRGVRRLVPPSGRERADQLGRLLYRVIGRYFAGSAFVAILHGLFVLVVGLLLGVPLAPLLALWATVFNLVPQIGGLVAGVPFVLLALTQGLLTGLIAAVLFVLYLNLENHIITPVVVGKAVDLSPIATMGGAIVGVSVAGVPGALVAVPFLGAAKAVYRELRGEGPRDDEPDEHLPGSGLLHRLRATVSPARQGHGRAGGMRRALTPPLLLPALLVLAVLLGACSGGDDGPEPEVVEGEGPAQVTNPEADSSETTSAEPLEDVPNPCELVTGAEVAEVTGQDVSATAYQQLGPASVTCNHLTDDAGTVGAAVGISTEGAEAELETYGELEDTEPVDGLGDDAVWSPTLGTLAVRAGDTLLTVNLLIVDDGPDELRDQATELATTALVGL